MRECRLRGPVVAVVFGACLALVSACSTAHPAASRTPPTSITTASSRVPITPVTATSASSTSVAGSTQRWDHVVVVVEENRDASSILGAASAPFVNSLSRVGLNFANMHGETHPSEPNYLALLSGSTQGLTDDSCPHTYRGDNLANQLRKHGLTFTGYAESLPRDHLACSAYPYARKHVPWVDFANVANVVSKPLTAIPNDFTALPDVSFVIPNLSDDMHDGTIEQGDAWLRHHLGPYATWTRTHRSLLIVTWDEDEGSANNQIATIAVGDGIAAEKWSRRSDHYTLLASMETAFGLPRLGRAAHADVPAPLT